MVTWTGDGTMAGYDPVTRRLKPGLFKFASPGTVDLNGSIRVAYGLGAGLNATTYPNALQATAPISFSVGDFSANPGKRLGVGMVIVRADKFPEGKIPTPSEVFNHPAPDFFQRSADYAISGPYSHTYPLRGPSAFDPNTKWWILLYPSAIINPNAPTWSRTNDAPINGVSINTIGRVLSFWSNRSPGKPTITSPVSGSITVPGDEFILRVNPADPDETLPEDAEKYNSDVNGIHFQRRPAPTDEDPNPEWSDLLFDWDVPEYEFAIRSGAWHIRGSRYWNGLEGTPYHEAMIANLGFPVVAGASTSPSSYQPGKGVLPSGDWQIRARTFDYGHAYPNSGVNVSQPGPLGINHATNWLTEPAADTYPATNTSPWSDPIRVSVPSQVPPPLPIYPKDDLAVSGNVETVPLRWQYRNTHQPPRTQYAREVQIRKVGDPEWSTIFSGAGANPFVDLPLELTQTPIPPMEVLPDGTFESGTLSGLALLNPTAPTTLMSKNDSTKAFAGNRYAEARNPPASPRPTEYTDDFELQAGPFVGIPSEYSDFRVDAKFWIDASISPIAVMVQALWLDSEGNGVYADDIGAEDFYDTPYVVFFLSRQFSGPAQWRTVSELVPDLLAEDYVYRPIYEGTGQNGLFGADAGRLTLKRPANGVSLILGFSALRDRDIEDPEHLPPFLEELRLDNLTVTATAPEVDDFVLTATNQYEWRVSATDTDGKESDQSLPARFWLVPAGASGEVRPVPASTIDGATLGCGTYTVEVFKRGGKVRVGTLDNISHLDWGRVRDDISTAEVTISGWDIDCGNLLAKLQTWAYEIVIHRDNGYSVDRVWEGPITLLTYENDKVTIDAKDVMAYAYRRIIKQRMTDSGRGNGTTVVDRARRVVQNVFAPDDPNLLAYLQVLGQPDDAMQYRSTPAYSRTAFEEIDDMAANSGLDYTAVGRSIMLWGTKHRIGTLPELRDQDLGASPIVSEYGMSAANVYSVSDGNGVHGQATRALDPVSGNNPDFGLIEMLSSTWASDSEEDVGTYTQAGLATVIESFENYAERSISDRWPPPMVVRVPDNTSLHPDTVLSIQQLVPGVVIPLRSMGTLRPVKATQKLDSVKVVVEKGKETITVTLSPFSRDDAAYGEGEE